MLQPKKPLKQLIQNAFKKGTEKSEMKKKMPQVNAEKARFEDKTKSKEYKSFDNMPRMKMKQTKTYKG